MPELPEVQTVVSELNPKLKNKVIKNVEVRLPKIVSVGPKTMPNVRTADDKMVKVFVSHLVGKKIKGLARRAKMIIMDIEGRDAVLVHLKMTGQLIFLSKKELKKPLRLLNIENASPQTLPAKWTHVIFDFADGSRLFYNDMRQFGYLRLVRDEEINEVRELQDFGPEPLDGSFDFKALEGLIEKHPKTKLKQFLMDPTIIAGIGNIYSDEILFYAKVRPTRPAASLNPAERKLLLRGIKAILTQAIRKAGSSVGDFVRPNGDWGGYGKLHKVYGRSGEKCKVCGTKIISIKFNGRTGSFCPHCQK
ncbi:MAG: bifunctional DNA-formamidopyrimidine glycosylase/DNA-(apurinic or apyrimidinic site) lyase [Candidatus Saccharibacteria bacterium]